MGRDERPRRQVRQRGLYFLPGRTHGHPVQTNTSGEVKKQSTAYGPSWPPARRLNHLFRIYGRSLTLFKKGAIIRPMKVVLQDIVREVAKTTRLALPDAQVVVKRILSTMEEGLINGQRIEIRNLGVFQIKVISGRKGRDLARNLSISLPTYRKVSFKAGKNLRRLFWDLPEESVPVAAKDGQLEMFLEAVNH